METRPIGTSGPAKASESIKPSRRLDRRDTRNARQSETTRHQSAHAPQQPPARHPAEEGIAGLDVFGEAPPAPRTTSRLPAVRESSQPIPLAVGHITTPPPAVAVPGPRPAPPSGAQSSLPSSPSDSPANPKWDPREASPTGQMRSAARQDVARRAIHELGVLGRELEVLPDWLEESGLVGIHQRNYRDAMLAYLSLCDDAWASVAEERLEQSGDEAEYRARALDVARRVKHMQEESQSVLQNRDFQISSRRPLFWSRRVHFARSGLATWMSSLATPADPLAMGQALFQLRGSVGLANASVPELFLFGTLVAGINVLGMALALGLALLQIPTILSGNATLDAALVGYLVLAAAIWVLALTLAIAGHAPLRLQLGATLFTPLHTVRTTRRGSPFVAGLMRGWSVLLLVAGIVGGIGALAESIQWLRGHLPPGAQLPHQLPATLQLIGGSLVTLAAPAGGLLVASLVLVALPLLLLDAARFTAELAQNPAWVSAARRAVLRPAIGVLGFLTGGLVIAVYLATTAAGLAEHSRALLIVLAPQFDVDVTWRAVLVFVALVAPYLLLVEAPFRIGVRRYKHRWLHDLATRRATLESHMRRLSVHDPRSGQQDVSGENLNAMQYDLILLQFYRAKIEEAERIRSAPFGFQRVLAFVILALLLALALDNAEIVFALLLDNRDALLHLLPGR